MSDTPTHLEQSSSQPCFRAYPTDSPETRARLIILALLADGDINRHELIALNRPETLPHLGIDQDGFVRVLHELCEDLAQLPRQDEALTLSRSQLSHLFQGITDTETRKMLLALISRLIQSDGHISGEELKYLRSAAQAWRGEHKPLPN